MTGRFPEPFLPSLDPNEQQYQLDDVVVVTLFDHVSYSWLAKANPSMTGRFPEPFLPSLDPNEQQYQLDDVVCASANTEIEEPPTR